jgi:hypothetical protein
MFWGRRQREEERWYLLPAMQHGARKKFYTRLVVAVVVGLVTAGALGTVMYLANRI